MATILYPTTAPATCEHCDGRGEVPTGYVNLYGTACYMICADCDGRGFTRNCERCCDTGIDLEAPVNLASPPPCPCCRPATQTA